VLADKRVRQIPRLMSPGYHASRCCRLRAVEDASMTDEQIPEPAEGTKEFARYIAIVIRNAVEDFHCEHLSDEQMK